MRRIGWVKWIGEIPSPKETNEERKQRKKRSRRGLILKVKRRSDVISPFFLLLVTKETMRTSVVVTR